MDTARIYSMETTVSQKLANLCECPMHRLEDRKALLQRVYDALLADAPAVLSFKGGMHRYTSDELANWHARQTIADLLLKSSA